MVAENLVSTITWVGLVVAIGLFLPLPSYAWFASIVLGAGCLAITVVALLSGPGKTLPPWLNTGTAVGAGAAGGARASGARCARATWACATRAR